MLSAADPSLMPYLRAKYVDGSTTGWWMYRLGDLFKSTFYQNESRGYEYHCKQFPHSIATEYMQRGHLNATADYALLLEIINNRTQRLYISQPQLLPSNTTIVIHIRLGDVIDKAAYRHGHTVYDFLNKSYSRYLMPLSKYRAVIDRVCHLNDSSKFDADCTYFDEILIVTGFHIGDHHLRSFQYLNEVIRGLRQQWKQCCTARREITIRVRINENPDEDVLVMANSKYFVQSGGGFSRLLAHIVTMKGGMVLHAR